MASSPIDGPTAKDVAAASHAEGMTEETEPPKPKKPMSDKRRADAFMDEPEGPRSRTGEAQ